MGPGFKPTARCHRCKRQRPADSETCPLCGAQPYPHRRTAAEHREHLEAVPDHDLIGRRLHGENDRK